MDAQKFLEYAKNVMFLAWDQYPANTILYSLFTLIGLIIFFIGLYDVKNHITFAGLFFIFVGVIVLLCFSGMSDFLPKFDEILATPIFFILGIFAIFLEFFVLYDEYGESEEEGDPRENTF